MKKTLMLLCALLLCGFFMSTESALAQETFKDGSGSQVAYGQDAARIVCLAPNLTEMLHFVGLGGRQVGRTEFCDYPPEVQKLPSVGGFADTSLEGILALRPNLPRPLCLAPQAR